MFNTSKIKKYKNSANVTLRHCNWRKMRRGRGGHRNSGRRGARPRECRTARAMRGPRIVELSRRTICDSCTPEALARVLEDVARGLVPQVGIDQHGRKLHIMRMGESEIPVLIGVKVRENDGTAGVVVMTDTARREIAAWSNGNLPTTRVTRCMMHLLKLRVTMPAVSTDTARSA